MLNANNNILVFSSCYGCGVCSAICPKHTISLQLNKDGFWQPMIAEKEDCINCGRCLDVCAFSDLDLYPQQAIKGFATWSKDLQVRKKASSGGTGFEIAKFHIEMGYKGVGVKYNPEKQQAEHFIADNVKAYIQSIGSKYIQSNTQNAFAQLKKGEKYVITGTPCQIASLRKYIRKRKMEDDVLLIDFFCHGVPSMNVWTKYLVEIERKIGKVTYASWRNKEAGWHDSWAISLDSQKVRTTIDWHDSYEMLIRGKKGCYVKKKSDGDLFYKFFLGDFCFNRVCYKCPFKCENSAADIRIGDLWGSKYESNEEGVTGVLVYNERGEAALTNSNVEAIIEDISVVTEGQQQSNMSMPKYYALIMYLLRSTLSLNVVFQLSKILRIGTIMKYKFANK